MTVQKGKTVRKWLILVRKIEKVTTLHVNFETVDGTVVGEKTFEKTSTDEEDVVFALGDDIVLPEGYHLADADQQTIRVNGLVGGTVVVVEKDAEPAPAPSENPKKDDTKKDDTKKEETKKEETKKASKTADTSDTSDVAAYAIPLVMSMVAISAIVVGRKKLS